MQQKLKICRICKVPSYLFSKGLCKSCWSKNYSKPIKKNTTPINKISRNQKTRTQQYLSLRKKYLQEHPKCEVLGCTKKAVDIHHKGGRDGDNLFNHFLAVCREHHHKIEMEPLWAKENNYTISRL